MGSKIKVCHTEAERIVHFESYDFFQEIKIFTDKTPPIDRSYLDIARLISKTENRPDSRFLRILDAKHIISKSVSLKKGSLV